MVFVDNLAYSLFVISFAGFILFYMAASLYLESRKKQRNISERVESAFLPLALIGIYMLVMGLWGQFTWPLPGSYNMLFYDPLVSFGILLIAFSASLKLKSKLEHVGLLGLLMGLMTIAYGIYGYNLKLTQSPIALLGMYLLYGLSGILSYPVLLMADGMRNSKRAAKPICMIVLALFCLLILFASLLSGYIAISAISAHLASPP